MAARIEWYDSSRPAYNSLRAARLLESVSLSFPVSARPDPQTLLRYLMATDTVCRDLGALPSLELPIRSYRPQTSSCRNTGTLDSDKRWWKCSPIPYPHRHRVLRPWWYLMWLPAWIVREPGSRLARESSATFPQGQNRPFRYWRRVPTTP